MPYAFKLPRMLRAVVPLMGREGCRRRVVGEFVALGDGHSLGRCGRLAGRLARLMPRLAAVVGPLDDLPEPTAGLRRVDAIGIHRRSLHVIDLPAAKQRPTDVPLLALAIR